MSASPPERSRSAARDKRQLILDSAIKVFAQTGYHGSRVSDIAREAGIAYARGETFYLDGRGVESLYLSFARLAPEALCAAVEQLGAIARRRRERRKRSA